MPGILAIVISLSSGCKAYQVGTQNFYRQDVRTVHIPIVESGSQRRFLGQRMTEALAKEVTDETPYQLANSAVADSVLRVRIVRDQKRVAGENSLDEARDIAINWFVEATWTDRVGTPLMERQLVKINRDVNFVPEGGQSMTTAQQELIDRIARQVVDQMELPW